MVQLVSFVAGVALLAVAAGMVAVPAGLAVAGAGLLFVSWRSE